MLVRAFNTVALVSVLNSFLLDIKPSPQVVDSTVLYSHEAVVHIAPGDLYATAKKCEKGFASLHFSPLCFFFFFMTAIKNDKFHGWKAPENLSDNDSVAAFIGSTDRLF